ncbi:salivary glue protein Sgs-4-like isoform X2 [Macrosteles quadrilineatus]|uniref:salivary glue protein Sgs-4-like isoform X2 n=1 Tax=Macrosteles quadrilineatus TaxID=74068 RepID=UPI0023E286EC|nr:salivary glue protein Sgs-4-like isoform X2 [Macrosteles quadrilineatus]
MRSMLFLLLTSTLVGTLLAQYPYQYGMSRQVTFPASYAMPSCQTPCQTPCQCCPTSRVSVVPYNYCPPHYLQQNIVPPPCPVYQPTPIYVPIPPPPKDCSCAHTTVTTPTTSNATHPPSGHPPICVQTVYVAKNDDDDKKEEKKKCSCKKKNCEHEHDHDHDHEWEDRRLEERRLEARRRAYIREQQRRALIRYLLDPSTREIDPGFGFGFDPSFGGGTSGRLSSLGCAGCPNNRPSPKTIIIRQGDL